MAIQSLLALLLVSVGCTLASQYGHVQYHQAQYPAHQEQVHYAAPVQYAHASAPVQYSHAPAPVQYAAAPVQYVHQPAPVVYQHVPQPTGYSNVADNRKHGAYGQQESGHSTSAHGQHANQGSFGGNHYDAQGAHNTGGYGAHGAQSDSAVQQGVYRNTGSYSRNQGSGYEKSYSFDKAMGTHDVSAEDVAQQSSHAAHNKQGHHNVGSKSVQDAAKHGSHSAVSGYGQSQQAHDKSVFDKYGYVQGGNQQGYSYSPLYGYGYH